MASPAFTSAVGAAAGGQVETGPAREADAEAWAKWCAGMGVKVHEAVEARLRPDGRAGAAGGGGVGGSGMRARTNIKANECFAVVPREACLSSTTSKTTQIIIDKWVELSEFRLPVTTYNLLRLSMTLMVERLEGRQSKWGPYLATLPQSEAKLPIMWREQEFRELRNSSLENRVEIDTVALEMAFEKVPALLDGGVPATYVTLKAFKDAATVVWSRAMCSRIDGGDGDAREGGGRGGGSLGGHEGLLVPIMDLCGHREALSSNARVDGLSSVNNNGDGGGRGIQGGSGSADGGGGGGGNGGKRQTPLRLVATRDISAGEDITLPVHWPDAPFLLLRLGILPSSTPPPPAPQAARVLLRRAPVNLDHQLVKAFVTNHAAGDDETMYDAAADALGVGRERTYVIGAEGEVPHELLALLAFAAAGVRQRNSWRKAEGGKHGPQRALMERARSRDLWAFPGVCKLLVNLVNIKMKQYALDEDDDDDIGGGLGGSGGLGATRGVSGSLNGGTGGDSQDGSSRLAAVRALRLAERRNLDGVLKRGVKRMKRLMAEEKPDAKKATQRKDGGSVGRGAGLRTGAR